jgi:hypothetical protein
MSGGNTTHSVICPRTSWAGPSRILQHCRRAGRREGVWHVITPSVPQGRSQPLSNAKYWAKARRCLLSSGVAELESSLSTQTPPRRRSSPGHPQPSLRSPALCAAPSLPPMPRPGGHVLGRSGLPQAGGGDVASDRCCDRLGAGGAALPGGSPPRGGWRTGLRPHARVKRRSLRRCPHCARGARTRLPLLRVSPLGTAADRSALEVRCLVD